MEVGNIVQPVRRDAPVQRNAAAAAINNEKNADEQLRELERDGLVSRTVFAEVPPKVEYCLTALGVSIGPLLAAMNDWAMKNVPEKIRRASSP